MSSAFSPAGPYRTTPAGPVAPGTAELRGANDGEERGAAARAATTDRTLRSGWELGSVGPLAASSYIVQAEPFPAHSRSLRSSSSSDHPVACKLSFSLSLSQVRSHRD